MAGAVVALAVACSRATPQAEAPGSLRGEAVSVTIFASPTCGCCEAYVRYLQAQGLLVELVRTQDVQSVKERLGVPKEMWSCHTAVVGHYFVEGHVPVEAVRKLLAERPAVDGIALPGMPPGSPGMSGTQEGPFVIYAVAGSRIEPFMTIK